MDMIYLLDCSICIVKYTSRFRHYAWAHRWLYVCQYFNLWAIRHHLFTFITPMVLICSPVNIWTARHLWVQPSLFKQLPTDEENSFKSLNFTFDNASQSRAFSSRQTVLNHSWPFRCMDSEFQKIDYELLSTPWQSP